MTKAGKFKLVVYICNSKLFIPLYTYIFIYSFQGNIEVFHLGEWGSICDDEWDTYDANVACKQLGFPGASRHTHSSQYGYGLVKIWMDNVYCYGTEKSVTDCR